MPKQDYSGMEAIEKLLVTKPLPQSVKEEVIRRFDRFCHMMTNRITAFTLARTYGSEDDWMQEAKMALIDTAEHFDPSRNVKFLTYAYHRVWGLLRNVMRNGNGPIRIPKRSISPDLAERLTPIHLDPYADPVAPSVDHDVIDVRSFLAKLGSHERAILSDRFGLLDGKPKNQDSIAVKMRISRQRVCQLQLAALAKLRKQIVDSF